jgi:hypothetical protein
MAILQHPIRAFDTEIADLFSYPFGSCVYLNATSDEPEIVKIVGTIGDKAVVVRGYDGTRVSAHRAGEAVVCLTPVSERLHTEPPA